jgi:hypothetical protein
MSSVSAFAAGLIEVSFFDHGGMRLRSGGPFQARGGVPAGEEAELYAAADFVTTL